MEEALEVGVRGEQSADLSVVEAVFIIHVNILMMQLSLYLLNSAIYYLMQLADAFDESASFPLLIQSI